MKVVSREPHIYLIDVALRPFQEKDEGRFYLPFIATETYTIEENKSYDGTSSVHDGSQRTGDWWKACMLMTVKKTPKLREEIARCESRPLPVVPVNGHVQDRYTALEQSIPLSCALRLVL